MSVCLSVRWQKMALLVFQRWAVCRQKPNVPFAGRLFYTDAQRTGLYAGLIFEKQMFSQ